MKLLGWNCQGLGSALTIQHLRALAARERPKIIFLMETKNKREVVDRVRLSLNLKCAVTIDPVGIAGGMSVMWEEDVKMEINESGEGLIDLTCKIPGSRKAFRLSLLHAPTNYQERLALWQRLRSIHSVNTLPWLCLGDFNEILYHWEKFGRREAEYYRMVAFQDMLNDCALMDLESKGCAFTWANNRNGTELVRKRLDRAVCNLEWRVLYPEAEVFALPAVGSDHSPILISFFQTP